MQIDFTEGRLSVKLDPPKALLHDTLTARDTAFAKNRARVEGTELAARTLAG